MGIRMLTLDVKTFLYTEDRGLQVPIVLDHDYIPHTHKIVGTQFCDTLSHTSFRTFHRNVLKEVCTKLSPQQCVTKLIPQASFLRSRSQVRESKKHTGFVYYESRK